MRNFQDFIDKDIAVSFVDETEHNIWSLRNCEIKTVGLCFKKRKDREEEFE